MENDYVFGCAVSLGTSVGKTFFLMNRHVWQ